MPEKVNEELAKEFESLLKDAQKQDREDSQGFQPEVPSTPEPPKEPKEPKEPKKAPKPEETKEPEAEPDLKEPEDDKEPVEEPETSKDEKEQTRFDRNWKKFQQEQADFRKEREEFRKEMTTLRAEKKAKEDPTLNYKDENGYSVREYQQYQQKLESEGDWEKAYIVGKRTNDLKTKAYQENFRSSWQENQQRALDDNPDLGNMSSALAKEVQELISSHDLYRLTPDGVSHAVENAKLKIRAKQVSDLETKNKELQTEVTRLNGLLGVGGDGKVHKRVGQKTFADMSEKEQFAVLMKEAREQDASESNY